jgi:hypothetical protein
MSLRRGAKERGMYHGLDALPASAIWIKALVEASLIFAVESVAHEKMDQTTSRASRQTRFFKIWGTE